MTGTLTAVAAAPLIIIAAPNQGAVKYTNFLNTSDSIVVTATRSGDGVSRDLLGASVTILSSDALENRQARIVSDVLRDVPGVSVSRSGGVGTMTQVRLRGTEANHTLVLIDGIEASDPFRGDLDFGTLIADDVAQVEILRGQQSALYGSDAIGGVIHYISASGADAPGVRGRVEAGTFGSAAGAVRIGGATNALDYVVSGAFDVTDGTPTARSGTRDLDAETATLSMKLSYEAAPNLRFKAVGRYSRTEAETNGQDFNFGSPTYGLVIDTDDSFANRAVYGLLRGELDLLDGRWSHALSTQISDTHREERTSDKAIFSTEGQRLKAAYDSSIRFNTAKTRHVLTLAVDVERESFRNVPLGTPTAQNIRRSIDNVGLVADYDVQAGNRFGFGASVRHDDNDHFGDATTYRVRGSARVVAGLHLRGAAGSGIKNPTIFELFGFDPARFIGNPALKPEISKGWEVGADWLVKGGRARLGATYFESVLEDEIYTIYSPTFEATPANRATSSPQHGVELFAEARIARSWQIFLAYTWLHARENGARELRRPEHIGSINVSWRSLNEQFGITATLRYNGSAYDTDFGTFSTVKLENYLLANVAADYRLTKKMSLFGRVENVFDADYEDVFSYRTPGRAAYAGLRARF